jgi:putative oxidoreductase
MADHLQLLAMLQFGLGPAPGSFALFADRLILGLFFAISGFHKLFNKGRHAELVATLNASHIPLVGFNQWWVPAVELLGGLSLLSGILAPLAALALAVECAVAVATDGWKRIAAYRPIDKADWLDDLLYLPETIAIAALLFVVTLGPGLLTLPELLS